MLKKILIIFLSLIISLSLCYFGYWFYRKKVGYITVYKASHNITQRTIIEEEDLLQEEIPKILIDEDIVISKNEILGKYVKLGYSIPKGSYIYRDSLEDNIKDLSHTLLNENEISYDIYTSEVKINPGSLDVGMSLDLYLTITDKQKVISDLLISNARIIGLFDQNGKQIKNYETNSRVNIVSIAVNRQDVSIINKALALGEIRVVTSDKTYDIENKTVQNNESELFNYLR